MGVKELAIVFSVLFILGFIILILTSMYIQRLYMDRLFQQNVEFRDEIKADNEKFFKEILKGSYSEAIKTKEVEQRGLFNTFVKLRDSIKDSVIAIMNDIKADRIAIYLLHNGNSSTHGIKFFKMSCICEKVVLGSGVREQSMDQSNVPINLFDDMLDKLIDNGRYIIINNEDTQKSNHRIFISAKKIKYSQAIAIYDSNNNILGFVLAEMDHEYSKPMADQEKQRIDDLVNQLTPILSYSDYVDTAMDQHES